MKVKNIIVIYAFLTTFIFAQSPKYDYAVFSMGSNQLVDSYANDVKVVGLVNYDRIDRVLTSSMQWGSIAIVIGATLETAFNKDDYYKYMMTALGGMAFAVVGFGYGAFSSIPKGYNVGKNRVGFQINMGQTMAEGSFRFIGNFGVVFRYPNRLPFIPDNYTIYVGSEDVEENISESKYSELHLTKYGIQLRKVGYNRTINFLYGIDFGYSKGSYSYLLLEDLLDTRSEWKEVSSFYFDIIVGANFNLTKNIHGSIEYQYGLYGAHTRKSMTPIFDNPAHGLTSFSIYTFLW